MARRIPILGAAVWWNVLDIFTKMDISAHKKCAWKWAGNSWDRWTSWLCDSLLLPQVHILKRNGISSKGNDKGTEAVAVVSCDFRGSSTTALVAMLARWACDSVSKGGLAQQADRVAMLSLLRGLFTAAIGSGRHELTIFIDTDCKWEPPSLPHGSQPADAEIVDGLLNLRPLIEHASELSTSLIAYMQARREIVEGAIPVDRALLVCIQFMNKSTEWTALWFLRQLVWFLGHIIEQCFFKAARERICHTLGCAERAEGSSISNEVLDGGASRFSDAAHAAHLPGYGHFGEEVDDAGADCSADEPRHALPATGPPFP